MDDILTLIKSAVLIIAAVFLILTAVGLLRYKDDMERILYARIHMLGVADMGCIIALLALNEPLLAITYLFLTPFASHAIANAYYYGEEER
ncbi:MAG: monovalent cation/H(+) antiporter subunit G [Methanobacterium sp.]|uniref:monovalent cation/H(+) antiporter subunit G n=1 Tax=Methanobacterium sp. TaxID=2164 RepID=UPI003D656E7A|nr:monovalent cation/H(+) antiporter subunit G [Methanobacterium sp.]